MGDSHGREDGSVDFAERDAQSSLDNGNRILYGAGVKDFLAFGVQFAEGNKQVNVRGDGLSGVLREQETVIRSKMCPVILRVEGV
jgi:hypothetical protein